MKGSFLIDSNIKSPEGNIYSNKSAIIIDYLLRYILNSNEFSLRTVAKETNVSLGLVQRVFEILVLKGILKTEGVRTAKKFFLYKPNSLLQDWIEHYSIIKKCKMRTYCSSFQNKEEILDVLRKSNLNKKIALALHSAAEAYGYKNTNLETLELYLLDPLIRPQLEKKLLLEPQERGYEVLIIEPYYKTLLGNNCYFKEGFNLSSKLLTFLDLYHFPLRGQEQAEFIAKRIPEIKRICKNCKSLNL